MPDLALDFTWYRDPSGYRLIPAKVPRRRPEILHTKLSEIAPARIVRNGGDLQSYRPLDKFSTLFVQFAQTATTEAGVLKFVERFGPLTHDGLSDKGDLVFEVMGQARLMLGGPGTALVKKLNVSIMVERDGVRLKVWPACLLDALWLQLAQATTRAKECPQCRKPFLIGVAVKRRKDAKFCSNECRVKFNSLERSR